MFLLFAVVFVDYLLIHLVQVRMVGMNLLIVALFDLREIEHIQLLVHH